MQKAFVLLSGGMDSTTCLYKALDDLRKTEKSTARRKFDDNHYRADIEAISINYGQRHKKEIDYAKDTCKQWSIKHTALDAGTALGRSMLTDASIAVPDISYGEIQGVSPTYVPFRNGFMLSLITSYVQQWVNAYTHEQCSDDPTMPMPEDVAAIYYGAHSEDAENWAYPDCTPEFNGAMANAIYIGSYRQIRLITPLQWSSKADVVRLGNRLGVLWENTWSCYKGEHYQCGTCPTCRSRRDAFKEAGIEDPTEYQPTVPADTSELAKSQESTEQALSRVATSYDSEEGDHD